MPPPPQMSRFQGFVVVLLWKVKYLMLLTKIVPYMNYVHDILLVPL